jgi:hypothetical protein
MPQILSSPPVCGTVSAASRGHVAGRLLRMMVALLVLFRASWLRDGAGPDP